MNSIGGTPRVNRLTHTDVNLAILEGDFPHKAALQHWMSLFLDAVSGSLASISRLFLRRSAEVQKRSGNAGHTLNRIEDVTRSSKQKHQLKRLQQDQSDLVQASAIARQRLDSLEKMLRDVNLRHTAVLYYQLNNLWSFCHLQLVVHKKQLIRMYEKRERNKMLEQYKKVQEHESQSAANHFSELDDSRQALQTRKRRLAKKIKAKKEFWTYFSRKKLENELKEIKIELAPIEKELVDNRIIRVRIDAKQAPKLKRLNLDCRRAINQHLIAYAQFYFVYFSGNNVTGLAKSTCNRGPTEFNFGTRKKCQKMELLINDRINKLENFPGFKKAVHRQARVVASQVKYSSDNDSIPAIQSLTFTLSKSTFEPGPSAKPAVKPVFTNVVKDGYWEVDKLLLS